MTGNRLWMIGVALAAVVVVALGWLVGISPMLDRGSAATAQLRTVDAQNAAQRAGLVSLRAQFDDLPALRAQLEAIQGVIPETADLDDFLDELEAQAQDAGVTISTFTATEGALYGAAIGTTPAAAAPSAAPAAAPAAAPTDASTPAATKAPSGVEGKLFTIPITVAVKGQPSNVMEFTDSVQKTGRFFLVTSSTFTGASTPGTAGGTLTGFVFVVQNPLDGSVVPK
jgi:Tfp pilus assembly protein PilO